MFNQNEYVADKLYEERRDEILRQSLEDGMLRREGLLKTGQFAELRCRAATWLGHLLVSAGQRLECAGVFRPSGLSVH